MNEALFTQAADSTGTLSGALADSPLFGEICDWGLSVIRAVQGTGNPILEAAARILSLVGDPLAYVLYMIVILWCVDERRGTRLGICLLASNGINHAVKQTLRVPRPFTREPGINLIAETGYSMPSGHSQNSAAFWPSLASYVGRRPLRLLLAFLPVIIGMSRVYLGVHYPTDVLAGWILGYSVSAVNVFLFPRAAKSLTGVLSRAFPNGVPTRARRWALILPTAAFVYLVNGFSSGDGSAGGLFLGFTVGAILLDEANRTSGQTSRERATVTVDTPAADERPDARGAFCAASGTLAQKALRAVLGLAGLVLIYVVLKGAFPGPDSAQYGVFRFVRYALIGLWGSWGAPTVFVRLGLSGNGR